jgi:hypothetical protein
MLQQSPNFLRRVALFVGGLDDALASIILATMAVEIDRVCFPRTLELNNRL